MAIKKLSQTPVPDDPILTSRDASQLLGVSVSTAQLWMETGALPSWKTPGGHRRCRLSDVTRLQTGARAVAKQERMLADEFIKPAFASYPMLESEQQRLIALADSALMDSPPDEVLDRITWLASRITGCPTALVSLLSSERQWFKSRIGLDSTQTPREAAFCSHAIMEPGGMIIEDALADDRFSNNPLVVGGTVHQVLRRHSRNRRRREPLGHTLRNRFETEAADRRPTTWPNGTSNDGHSGNFSIRQIVSPAPSLWTGHAATDRSWSGQLRDHTCGHARAC